MTSITFTTSTARPPGTALVVPVFAGLKSPRGAGPWPSGLDPSALAALGFEAEIGQVQSLVAADGHAIVAVGMGEPDEVTTDSLRRAAACAVRTAWRADALALSLLDAVPAGVDRAAAAQAMVEGAALAAYRFTTYRSSPKACHISTIAVVTSDAAAVEQAVAWGAEVARAVCLARDLVNEPAGALTPARLADRAAAEAARVGMACGILDEAAIVQNRMGGLLGVARGSAEPPRFVELTYEPPGVDGDVATVVLVGKGITFDSGGLSLKTADGMMTMKTDMSGAAAVLAAMSVLPSLAPPVRVVGLLPITENMPGDRATKPGDILETRNGTTVEVLNTDAEGRLVLADALAYGVERSPAAIVDVATLTGAQVVALGRKVSGLMGTDDDLLAQIRAAGDRAGEPVWPLPLTSDYRSHLDSDVADLKNIGKAGEAGSVVAGLFLREFVGEVPWAHLDIAGPARAGDDDGFLAKGGTGVGVRTLIELVRTFRVPGTPAADVPSFPV
ncbi:MAG TPA: leucyl aminopeptidase [Acidimicrobiales bacterium]|nr:leucyl aminopeptidase [Acidimicrobiales bacterium]